DDRTDCQHGRESIGLRNRAAGGGVGGGMPKYRLPFEALFLALLLAAPCARPASSAPPVGSPGSGSPGSSAPPSAAPSIEGIDHPTGATDVVLQLEEGGGFVPIDFLA